MKSRNRLLIFFPMALMLFLCLCIVLFQFTEIEAPITAALRGVVPEGMKDILRPLRSPQVLHFRPLPDATDIAPNSPITVIFLTAMSPGDAAIRITPEVKGTFSWSASTLTFTPSEPWPLGSTVTVTVTRDARSWLMRRAEKVFSWSFSVLAPTTIVETSPRQGAQFAYSKDRLVITFSREMDQQSVESRLLITPPIGNQKLQWQGRQLLISGNLRPSTNYRIALLAGAEDSKFGMAMASNFEWSFTTTQEYPYLAIINIGRYGVTAAEKPTTLKIRMVNVSRIDAALYKFDTATYIKTLGFSYDNWRTFKPSGDPIKSWSITPKAKIDETVTQDVQLEALPSGTYFLVAKSPEGVNDTQVLVATRTALTMKRTADEALVWATNISDGSPVPNLSLAFYNSKGQVVGNGTTDKDGLFKGTIQPTKSDLHLIGTRDGDGSTPLTTSFAAVSDVWDSGIEPWRFENVQWQWSPQKHSYRVYIYSDRPIYRPGQTVYFKAIVRKDDDGEYSQPPAGTEMRVKVSDWQERVLYNKTLKTNDFGSLADSFIINPEAGLGSYQIIATIGDEEYQNEIQIEEYRKPEYSVSAKTDREAYINGDTINATIRANYFFGGAVSGAQVHWTLYSNDHHFYWSGGDYDFGNTVEQKYYGNGREVSSGDDVLNANGELVLKLPANISTAERSQIFTLEATVTDTANQPQSTLVSALIHRGNFYIGIKPTQYVAEKGREARFDFQTVDTNGKATGRVAINYTLNLISWNCNRTKDSNGRNIWKCDEIKTEIQRGDLTTDANGKSQLAFTPPKGGSYRLDAQGRDARGNRVLGQTWLWVSDRAQFLSWRFENNDRIELVLDKKQYNVGDTAQVMIQSPYPKSTALVTIERGKIISHRLVLLESNSTTITLPITNYYYPNVYVSVVLMPQGGFPDTIPSFKVGLANIKVVSNAKQLNVSVASAQSQYSPRDKAAYTIKTTDSNGKPVSAEVSLAVVDKAVLALARNFGPDITDGFYGTRDLAVKTSQSLTVYLARVNQREDFGGGGGGEEEARKLFPDVPYWNPTIVTDANGTANVEFKLPDSVTTWTAIANAATASTQVGKGTGDTLVAKELIVRPVLPRFLNVGDKTTLGAIVNNSSEKNQSVNVSINASNLMLSQSLTQTVTVGAGQSARVNWDVTVPSASALASIYSANATMTTTVTMRARTSSATDAVELSLPIEPFGEKRVVGNAGQADDAETRFAIHVPNDATFSSLKLSISPSLAAGLIDSLDYLTGYPYGCVEQTMSRFLPDVLVKQTLDKLQIKNDKLQKELPKQVEDSLTRLYAFQHGDGGWGWWEADDSQPYETAYVVFGLLQAKKAGYTIDEKTITRALDYLKTPLIETTDYNLKVYIAYVMAEAGKGDIALARAMIDRQDKMTLNSRATLALLLNSLGDTNNAKAIVSDLEKKVIETAQHAHWEESPVDRRRWEYFDSNGRTTATILRAMLALDPQSPLVQKTVRYLMINRLGGYWRTTQETAQTIIALSDYLAQSRELESNHSYEVFVDGASVARQSVNRENIAQQQNIALRLAPGEHAVRIVKNGSGRLYYASAMQYYGSVESVGAAKSLDGAIVTREYVDPKNGNAKKSFQVGEIVRVKLTIDIPREGWYMMVTDPLPAGFEAINYSLNTTGIEPANPKEAKYYWSRPDLRDDRAVFFTTYLWKGKHTFSYLIRATSSGTFRALPAEVVPMYEPEVFGRSASAEFVVK